MGKVTDSFKKRIQEYLENRAQTDILFAAKYDNPAKNIDDCCTYILNQVQKSGCNGFDDSEVYGMAVHYYDEESIEIGKPVNARVVVNHRVEKTKTGENGDVEDEEEPQEQRRGTMGTLKTLKKKEVKKEIPGVKKQSLFDYESED